MSRVKTKSDIYLDGATWITLTTKSYKYDNSGNVIKELDALGYDSGTGTTVNEKINSGYGTESAYNLAGKLVTVLDAVSKQRALPYTIKYDYDALGRKLSETNAKGVITLYTLDKNGNITKVSLKKNQNSSAQILKTATYDLMDRLKTQTDGIGATTTYGYNAFDKVRKAIYPGDATIDTNTVIYQYDENSNLKKQSDSTSKISTIAYDNQGRVISKTQNSITTSTAYDKNGNKRFETNANGVVKTSTYDQLNRMITASVTVQGSPQTTTYGYDANSNQTSVTNWRGNTSTNIYDPLNRLIEKRDPYTIIQKLEYTKNSLQSKSFDALNNPTTFSYDINGRLLTTTDALGHSTSQGYDDAGNVSTKTDGRNISTTFNFDEFGRLKSVINAKGEQTSYTYDLNGNMLTQTDGNGNTTIFKYNVANKLITRIDPNGTGNPKKTESYTYYADSSMKTKLDRNGKITNYSYDVYGRLTNQVNGSASLSYTYDNNGNQLTMTDATGTTTRTYDELGRVLAKDVQNIGTSTFQYDITTGVPDGCTGEKSIDPKGNVTLKVNDKAGRLLTVTADNKITTYSYFANGSRQSVVYTDGSREDYTYYADGLNKTLVNKKADGTVIDNYSYTYDAAHNQTSKTDKKGVTSYTYDSLNRLETVTEPNGKVTSYTFDKAGNRLSETATAGTQAVVTTYTYNDQNRLTKTVTQDGTQTEKVTYVYDSNGNMINKSRVVVKNTPSGNKAEVAGSKAGDSDTNYQSLYKYDVWNQLTKATEGKTISVYGYNGDGLRVQKTVNGTSTRYLYEADKVVFEVDGLGNQTARNVYGINLLARTVDGQQLFYMYNGHADVTALIDSIGAVKQSYYYDAFGNIAEQSGTVNNSITYAGYQYDSETGLYYLNARMYDAKIARFMQEDTYTGDTNDPLSLNLYTYCQNEPIMYSDPTGHWQESDKNLTQDARIAVSRLTDLYYSTNDPAKKAQISKEANQIRSNSDNIAKTTQNSAVATQFTAALKKDGSVSASDWLKISNTYTGTTTQNAVATINSCTSSTSLKFQSTVESISHGLDDKKPTQLVVQTSSSQGAGKTTVTFKEMTTDWTMEGYTYALKSGSASTVNLLIDSYNNSASKNLKIPTIQVQASAKPILPSNQTKLNLGKLAGNMTFVAGTIIITAGAGEAINALTTPKAVVAAIETRSPVIIGETMKRVEMEATKYPGATILNDMPEYWNMGLKDYEVTSKMMAYNRSWILEQLKSGRQIIDIGYDVNRNTPSIFYQMEQNMIKNYGKLNPK